MKIPFLDFTLYNNVLKATRTSEDGSISKESKRKVTFTYSRDTVIPPEFVGYTIAIHNGKKFNHLRITQHMVGYKLGAFSYTKRVGSSIHNSEHNAKKKAKARRKITERKIRKTAPKKTVSKARASGPQKVSRNKRR